MNSSGRIQAPPDYELNFKDIFLFAVTNGCGQIDGLAWTPETLTDAINAKMPLNQAIELRTVQYWFQSNDRGIGDSNIERLSSVFSSNDPEAMRIWRIKLHQANRKTKEQRAKTRKVQNLTKRTRDVDAQPTTLQKLQFDHRENTDEKSAERENNPRNTLAILAEKIYLGYSILTIPQGNRTSKAFYECF